MPDPCKSVFLGANDFIIYYIENIPINLIDMKIPLLNINNYITLIYYMIRSNHLCC